MQVCIMLSPHLSKCNINDPQDKVKWALSTLSMEVLVFNLTLVYQIAYDLSVDKVFVLPFDYEWNNFQTIFTPLKNNPLWVLCFWSMPE